MIVHDAVELFGKLRDQRRILHADHRAAEQLRLQPDFGRGAHHADRVRRIGCEQHDVGIGRLDGAHDRREIDRRGRIALVVDDLQAVFLRVLARADQHVVGRLEKFFSPSLRESDSVTARENGQMERASHGAEGLFRS